MYKRQVREKGEGPVPDLEEINLGIPEMNTEEDVLSYLVRIGEILSELQGSLYSQLLDATIEVHSYLITPEGVELLRVEKTQEIKNGKITRIINDFGNSREVVNFEEGLPVTFYMYEKDDITGGRDGQFFWDEDNKLSKLEVSLWEDGNRVAYMLREWLERGEGYELIRDTYKETRYYVDELITETEYISMPDGIIPVKEIEFDENSSRWLYRELPSDFLDDLKQRIEEGEDWEGLVDGLRYWVELRKNSDEPSDWRFLLKPGELKIYYKGNYLATLSPQVIEEAAVLRENMRELMFLDYFINKYESQLGGGFPYEYEIEEARSRLRQVLQAKFENGETLNWDSDNEEVDRFIAFALAYAENFLSERRENPPENWIFRCGELFIMGPPGEKEGTSQIRGVAAFIPILMKQENFQWVLDYKSGEFSYIPLTVEDLKTRFRISYFFSNKEDYVDHFKTVYGEDAYERLLDLHTTWGEEVDRISAPWQSMGFGQDESGAAADAFIAIDWLKAAFSLNTWGTLHYPLTIS